MKFLKELLLNSTFALATISVYAYFATFFYQSGYLKFFGFRDTAFIELSLENMLSLTIPTAILIMTFLGLYNILLSVNMFFSEPSIQGYAFNIYIIPWVFGAFLSMMIFRENLFLPVVVLLIGIFSTYRPDYFVRKKIKKEISYTEFLRNTYIQKQNDALTFENIKQKTKDNPLLLVSFIVTFLVVNSILFSSMGYYDAKNQKYYMTTEIDDVNYILVKTLSDRTSLLVNYDPITNVVKNNLFIIDLVSNNDDTFEIRYFERGVSSTTPFSIKIW